MGAADRHVAEAKRRALSGERLERGLMLSLMGIKEGTPEFYGLGKAAREVSSAVTKDRSYLWGAIGIDFTPCAMSCDFCSMGERWGLVTEGNSFVMGTDEIVRRVGDYVRCGIRWVVLRTNQEYDPDRMLSLIREVRSRVSGRYEIGLNAGEFEARFARDLRGAGAGFAYHSLRLKEGVHTAFDPARRLSTLAAVREGGLDLVHLVEPIGVEHTDGEIVDSYESILAHGARVSGGMARIPVAGTPLGAFPQVSDERLAKVIAMTRLAYAGVVEDICVHPANRLAMRFGANVAVIDGGAVPREGAYSGGLWRGVTCGDVKRMFQEEGYTTYSDNG